MRRFWFVLAVVVCLVNLSLAADSVADEKETPSRVAAVSLFKNGLAVIKREVDLAGPGIYRLTDVPEPVHGTFMIESGTPLEARVELRDVKGDDHTPLGVSLQEELAGLTVTIYGRNNKAPITGRVVPPPKRDDDPTSYNPEYAPFRSSPEPASRFLILKTGKGVSYVDLNDIASLEAEGQPAPRMQRKPVLLLEAGKDAKPGKVTVNYLAHGISWAPSYRVDVSDAKKLIIEQHAVVRNELAELKDTEVSLISGYPSVQFASVLSPLAAHQSWQRFFQQLARPGSYEALSASNAIASQIAYNPMGNRRGGGGGEGLLVAPNLGDTIDLNFHSIGKRSLKKGTALALATGKAEADYERIVDWTIPDNRNEWGSPQDHQRVIDPNTGDPIQDDVWDALKFKNPLPFPMTTAPALVASHGKFNGQRQVLWTNRGELATLRVNKALSLRTRCVEFEHQKAANGVSEREIIWIGGRRFRQATVDGELRLCNHRGSDVKLVIKRHFSGDLLRADGDPKVDLREEGIWTVNKRNELVWTLTLKPGEERNLTYQYKVLVHF
jgi:hypothetical protein